MFDWFIPLWLDSLWHFVVSAASIFTIIGVAATLIAVFLPKPFDWITDLRKWAIVVAVIAFSFTAIAGKFFNDGLNVKQAQWEAAVAAEAVTGDSIGAEAERSVHVEPADSRLLRDDPWNRDNWKQPGGK